MGLVSQAMLSPEQKRHTSGGLDGRFAISIRLSTGHSSTASLSRPSQEHPNIARSGSLKMGSGSRLDRRAKHS